MKISLPSAQTIEQIMTGLLGRNVDVEATKQPFLVRPRAQILLAIYSHADGEVGGICLCEAATASYAGAALSMIPAKTAETCAKTGRFEPGILENAHEVLNILASVFNKCDAHVSLREVLINPVKIPQDLKLAVKRPKDRVDLSLKINGYGGGRISFLAAA